jgi:hypothetical protein
MPEAVGMLAFQREANMKSAMSPSLLRAHNAAAPNASNIDDEESQAILRPPANPVRFRSMPEEISQSFTQMLARRIPIYLSLISGKSKLAKAIRYANDRREAFDASFTTGESKSQNRLRHRRACHPAG